MEKSLNWQIDGVDVTSDSARFLVAFMRDLLNSNNIEEIQSTRKMGWHNDVFLPYDNNIDFDGEEDFTENFKSLRSHGDFNLWLAEMYRIRKNNIPLKLVMATSFASVLLEKLHRQSFVTLVWGKTGGGKTVAGRVAMSIWGDSQKGKLYYSLDSTNNFYYRIADFFNNIPVFFDELQAYKGKSIEKLVMSITEGIDRGKARADGGIEKNRTWNNAFIMTGEQSISDIQSGGGTLNRLIEIYIEKDIIENGIETCDVINENYGHAGIEFINYIKTLSVNDLTSMFREKYNELKSLNITEEKQLINMSMLLLADQLACNCIFKEEKSLKSEDVKQYMFSKEEIDNTKRAYEVLLDECIINETKFNPDNKYNHSEFWGIVDDFEICIISKKLREILAKNGFNYNKVLKDWYQQGLVEKNNEGKFSSHISRGNVKGNFVIIKKEVK